MKTIAITISRGSIAKNILQTRIYEILRSEPDTRLIIVSSAGNDPEFIKTFGGYPNVIFEKLQEHKWQRLDYFFTGLHKALVYNASTELRDRYGILSSSETNSFRRIFKRLIFKPLRSLGFLKELVRFLDLTLVPDPYYKIFFDTHKPDLVFSTNPIEDADSFFLKQARKRGIKIIAMPKSWDNLPKMSFRVKPDRLLVWGESTVEDALRYQNMKKEDMTICGVPHFDIYHEAGIFLGREEFCARIGADPKKDIIIFGSEGKVTPGDPEIAEIIWNMVQSGKLVRDCTLFIRPYFALKGEEEKFRHMIGRPNTIVDHWFHHCLGFRDSWDYSREQMVFFANLLRHASIMICHASTLTLDAAAFDKPVVHIGFDGYAKKPYGESTLRWYRSAHFGRVTNTHASIIVKDQEELEKAVNEYLKNPARNSEGRERLRNFFCYRIDGKSSERIAQEVLKFL